MILKVPVFWVWILGFFVVIATGSLYYFGRREAEVGPGKYGVGTCLKNDEFGIVSRVEGHIDGHYLLRILSSKKYPDSELYRLDSEQKRPIEQIDSSSSERPMPCPKP
ncbi:MAG TPA: hypothetical protein PL182_01810 [Pseudobdellovibrionaceae bacterium]|nr:hypothetical protein [Pseudobdellovibrionaceae bacterium]